MLETFMKGCIDRQGLQGRVREFGFDCDVTEEQAKAGLLSYEQWWVVPEHITYNRFRRCDDPRIPRWAVRSDGEIKYRVYGWVNRHLCRFTQP